MCLEIRGVLFLRSTLVGTGRSSRGRAGRLGKRDPLIRGMSQSSGSYLENECISDISPLASSYIFTTQGHKGEAE